MRLASNLERAWTSQEDKRHAAILLRNAAIETPHCHFCGSGQQLDLYESRYNPKARICKLCALEIAAKFNAPGARASQEQLASTAIEPATIAEETVQGPA